MPQPLKRTCSTPFAKKPIPVHEDIDDFSPTSLRSAPASRANSSSPSSSSSDHDDALASSSSSRSQTSARRRQSQRQYSAIQVVADDDDDPGESRETSNHDDDGHGGAAAGMVPFEMEQSQHLERHLSLLDTIAVGVGGTIGSGLFVLAGLVAHEYAGPATVLSWAISGSAACLSGCCYAELAARIPLAGGAYAYTYVAVGELPAVWAAACLSLEYVAAASAVARSWGDKFVAWMIEELGDEHWIHEFIGDHGTFNPLAFVISSGSVLLLLNGVKESKRATNVFTALKISVVTFMIVVGFVYVNPSNWSPFIPPQLGVSGVIRGATGTFFGYLGYDQGK